MKYVCLLLALLCFSCSSKQEEKSKGGSSVTVDLAGYLEDGQINEIVLSDLVDSVEYIPLYTPDELPVDVLLSVKMSAEYVFVLDRQQILYRFDRQGRFLNLIGSRGEGSEEYVSAIDFEIDENRDIVYLFDIYRKKIKAYRMSGAFLEDIVVPEGVESMALLNDSAFVGYKPWYATADKSDRCVFFGKSSEVYETVSFRLDERVREVKIDLFRMPNFSQVYSDSRFRMPFDSSIYLISDSCKVTKEVEFEMGNHLLPVEASVNNELYNQSLNSSYIFELNANGTDDFVYMSFFYLKKHYRVIYDIDDDKFYTVFVGREPEGIVNDLDGRASFWPMWFASDKMIGVVSSDALEMEYDNPILLVVHK